MSTNRTTAGVINAILTMVIFILTLPALAAPARGWLKFVGYLIVADALFSLVIGLDLWILTLRTKEEFSTLWDAQSSTVQSLIQTSVSPMPRRLTSSHPEQPTDHVNSLIVADTITARPRPLSRTRPAQVPLQQLSLRAVPHL
jgi:hypothetical protein